MSDLLRVDIPGKFVENSVVTTSYLNSLEEKKLALSIYTCTM